MTVYWLIVMTEAGPAPFGIFFTEGGCELVRAMLRLPSLCMARETGVGA